MEELIAIVGAVCFLILIIILIIVIQRCCTRNRRNRDIINNDTRKETILLNSHSTRPHELSELKRNSKLSNLEVNRVCFIFFFMLMLFIYFVWQ